jgi:predicted dehydrogenase
MFETDTGVICQFNSSWAVRVRRDDLLTMQVDGTEGSAIVGLRKCWVQHQKDTPRPVWNPDIDSPLNFYDNWTEVTDDKTYDNAFKIQWEMFLKHVVADTPFPWTLREGAKGVQLAELSWESNTKGAWVEVP